MEKLKTTGYFLSLNRYERKKEVKLAIQAYHLFLESNPESRIQLVIAGGYDS